MRRAYEIAFHGKAIVIASSKKEAEKKFFEEQIEFAQTQIDGTERTDQTAEDWGYSGLLEEYW